MAGRVVHDSPQLYFEIQSLNDYGTESLSALLRAVEHLRGVVQSGDETQFARLDGTWAPICGRAPQARAMNRH